MHRKLLIAAVVLSALLLPGITGCAKKQVRHLASDVCLVTPDITTKEQILVYLGQPDEQLEIAGEGETWLYYDMKKDFLRSTPYVGEKIGEKKYEMVKVTFAGNIVQTCIYRTLSEEEYDEGGLTE